MSARALLPPPARRALRARFGIWPLMEARNRLVMGPRALALRRFEDDEVRRLAAEIGPPTPTLVTTVIPTYRRPESLLRSVRSALDQTVADHGVIVVDDGAGLPDLPDDERLVAVSLRRNSAVLGLVRNVGIRLTDSAYVAFLDDDNTWRPTHLEVAVRGLESGADLVYTAVERRLYDGTPLDVLSKPFDRARLAEEAYVDSNSIVVRRLVEPRFSVLPRRRATLPKEDWEFVYRTSRQCSVLHVPVPTVDYLVNAESYYTSWKGADEHDDP